MAFSAHSFIQSTTPVMDVGEGWGLTGLFFHSSTCEITLALHSASGRREREPAGTVNTVAVSTRVFLCERGEPIPPPLPKKIHPGVTLHPSDHHHHHLHHPHHLPAFPSPPRQTVGKQQQPHTRAKNTSLNATPGGTNPVFLKK